MPTSAQGFEQRIARLKSDLVEQGRRVQRMLEAAVESVFDRDDSKARWVCDHDAVIDKVDVDIERAAVQILVDGARGGTSLGEAQVRWVLTIVKVNNELERIADEAVQVAERLDAFIALPDPPPDRFRVMANSVIGILENVVRCFDTLDADLARIVLASDDAVEAFEQAILRETQEGLRAGATTVDFAFAVNSMAAGLDRVNDHCTNIAEQVIYVATGAIVRHSHGHWTAPEQPL